MAVIGSDNFDSATDDADIAGRTPDVGGAWTACSSLSGNTFYASDANRVRMGPAAGGRRAYYINSSPATAEYDVQADVYVVTNSGNQIMGIAGRLTSAGDGGYYARFVNASGEWTLFRITSISGDTSLGTYSATPSVSTAYTLKLEIRDAAKKLYIDGVERISSADNTTTAAGFGGIYSHSSTAGSNSAGHHVDNLVITDLTATTTYFAAVFRSPTRRVRYAVGTEYVEPARVPDYFSGAFHSPTRSTRYAAGTLFTAPVYVEAGTVLDFVAGALVTPARPTRYAAGTLHTVPVYVEAATVPEFFAGALFSPTRLLRYAHGTRVAVPVYVEPATLETSVVAELRALDSLAAHVGDRIYPELVPQQGTRPCLLYDLQAEPRVYDLDGPSGIAEATLSIEIQAFTRSQCRVIADLVRRQLADFTGPLGGDQGVVVIELTIKNESSDAVPLNNADDKPVRVSVQEYLIRWREA